MKHLLIATGIFLVCSASNGVMAQDAKLTISYSFKGIEEGYDHNTKTTVFLNGEELCTSEEHKESEPMRFTCDVAPGTYTVQVVNYAYYGNTWEEHTIANSYSIDAIFEKDITFKKRKKYKIGLLFDLDNGTSETKK